MSTALREPLATAALLDAPERAMDLSPGEAAVMLARIGALEAVLRARLATTGPATGGTVGEDRLLSVTEVAERLGMTEKQVYRRAHRWAFTRRAGRRTLRFSEAGLRLFMAGKKH